MPKAGHTVVERASLVTHACDMHIVSRAQSHVNVAGAREIGERSRDCLIARFCDEIHAIVEVWGSTEDDKVVGLTDRKFVEIRTKVSRARFEVNICNGYGGIVRGRPRGRGVSHVIHADPQFVCQIVAQSARVVVEEGTGARGDADGHRVGARRGARRLVVEHKLCVGAFRRVAVDVEMH